ncbi:MAG: membrane or secreted protein [Bacteroidales bacterium]|jgi:hypothetical protein|nr:membrane or secreted protein [Bacteroidales bacterium]
MNLLLIIFICIILIALSVAGFAIKILLKKNGEFKKQCSVKDPKTGEYLGCTCNKKNNCHNSK